jgi:molybdopterin-guanine dinucleotide biosynthesis protein A
VYHPAMTRDVTAFVLAGGKSARMGTDKAFVLLDGRTLLDRALAVLRTVTADVQIVGDPAKYGSFARCVEDIYRNCGPLGGIHAALHSSASELNVMLAVDLPFVTAELLQFLLLRARANESSEVTVPRVEGRLQPLCAVYRREFVVAAEQALRAGQYKINPLFEARATQVIEEDALVAAWFSPENFRNLNAPEDLAETK